MRYRGYYLDAETGYYYLQSRYYEPEMRRFINADDILLAKLTDNNLFSYCNNNPSVYVDILGFAPWNLLPYPGYIHNIVQQYLAICYRLSKEVAIRYRGKIVGRIDLVDKVRKQIWEIKPYGHSTLSALAQLNGYILSAARSGIRYRAGRSLGMHIIYEKIFKITTYSIGGGLIYYNFSLTPTGKLLVAITSAIQIKLWLQKTKKDFENWVKSLFRKPSNSNSSNPDTGDHSWI